MKPTLSFSVEIYSDYSKYYKETEYPNPTKFSACSYELGSYRFWYNIAIF